MSLVKDWVHEAESKDHLANLLTRHCYVSGKPVSDAGKGCKCLVHRAFRAEEAETLNDQLKPLLQTLMKEHKETIERLSSVQQEWKIKDEALKVAHRDILLLKADLGGTAQKLADAQKFASNSKQATVNLETKVEAQAKTIQQLSALKEKINSALEALK